ncbi:appr-1-p processing enzyme family domain protein [Treponema vincentii ATCC 35580]|uniref:Appr-1-p processing enzyme family domain protein n=1 Tax=Treponema vincentii ATCC 35580 TaxID=596324 RepID=C8PRG2_9SPIR|nr:appr-1-p processing enzyme family domain protein [Treponema vincentii ATCC 35580]
MNQKERRVFLINYLLKENANYHGVHIPDDEDEQRYLLRSLMNVRPPQHTSEEFLRIQDSYLQEAIRQRGITDLADLKPVTGRGNRDWYVWRGDITTLKVDAIVNAANSGMTGCWQPCHACIDNCIHTFAGVSYVPCVPESCKNKDTKSRPEPQRLRLRSIYRASMCCIP